VKSGPARGNNAQRCRETHSSFCLLKVTQCGHPDVRHHDLSRSGQVGPGGRWSVSHLRGGSVRPGQHRLLPRVHDEFTAALYRANTGPLHLLLDAADLWAPQRAVPDGYDLLLRNPVHGLQ